MTELRERLLGALRLRLDAPALEYADPPVPLAGGYYSEIFALELRDGPPGWCVPLVLRIPPPDAPAGQFAREALVQEAVVAQGFPSSRVLWWSDDPSVVGRPFMLMERIDGRSALAGASFLSFVRDRRWIFREMPAQLAQAQASLHALDAAPIADELAARGIAAGPGRLLDEIGWAIEAYRAPELSPALQWLLEHRPEPRPHGVVCHGDLWPGNMLLREGSTPAVIDWTLACICDAELDVGFASLALAIAPAGVPRPVQALVVSPVGRALARRFVDAYAQLRQLDRARVAYYDALRCLYEFVDVVRYRHDARAGRPERRPPWDFAAPQMLARFQSATGVRVPRQADAWRAA